MKVSNWCVFVRVITHQSTHTLNYTRFSHYLLTIWQYCNSQEINYSLMKSLKCKPSAEFGGNIGIFGLKTTFHAYVLGEHTSMKNEL